MEVGQVRFWYGHTDALLPFQQKQSTGQGWSELLSMYDGFTACFSSITQVI